MPAIKATLDEIVFAKRTITSLVGNSQQFQSWLASTTRKRASLVLFAGTAGGFRKYRYDTVQLPLARQVLRHEGILKTAKQIAAVRRGNVEALLAKYYLATILGVAGMKNLLLVGMCADAGDEDICIVRSVDRDNPDASWPSTLRVICET